MSAPIDTSEEVLSGEAVAIDAQPLGFFMRSLGALIDMVLGYALIILCLFLQAWMYSEGQLTDAIGRIMTICALALSFLIVPMTVETLSKGRSLGKLAVGGRIVRADGGAIGFRHAFIRALVGVVEVYLTFGGLAVITGALTARSQRLGDLIAGTYSQRVRTPQLAVNVPVMPPELVGWAGIADVARLPDRLARRISQFLSSAPQMVPGARAHVAQQLLAEASPFVSPLPAAVPERALVAISVVRRQREYSALITADRRAERLTGRRVGV